MTALRAHPPDPVAPWAEIVPGAPYPMTIQDLLDWPDDDGYRYELVEGVLVRVAGSGDEATTIGATIVGELYAFVRPRRLGVVTGADGVYKFPGAETGLLPDAGFYAAARRALIAVEVASPSQKQNDMDAKARTYLRGGTLLVWVVWPMREQVDVWRSDKLDHPAATLGPGDTLDGEDVISGFAYRVADVFTDPLD